MIFLWIALILVIIIASIVAGPCYPDFSETCFLEQLDRFQTLIAGVAGFGGLIAAAIYNGQQDRAKEERTEDRHGRNLAHALALECRELGIECGNLGRSIEDVLYALKKHTPLGGRETELFKDRMR